MQSTILNTAAAALALIGTSLVPALAEEVPHHGVSNVQLYNGVPNLLTYWDIRETLGMVPAFFDLFPKEKLPEMWEAYKEVQFGRDTVLDGKTKQLIGLAVAAEAGCSACIYFQSSAAMANGASFQEIQETIAIHAIGREWSYYLTADTFPTVKKDTDALVARGALVEKPVAVN